MQVGGGGLGADVGGEAVGDGAWGAQVGDSGPAVAAAGGVGGGWCPEWQVEPQIAGHSAGVGFVEGADGGEAVVGGDVAAEREAGFIDEVAEAGVLLGSEALRRCGAQALLFLFAIEDVAEIDQRVAGDGEGELRLAGAGAAIF